MNYKAHQAAGICLGACAAVYAFGIPNTETLITYSIIMTGAASIGALMPDIDEPSSTAGRTIAPVSAAIKTTSGHRGFFHSPLAVILLYFGLTYIFNILHISNTEIFVLFVAFPALLAILASLQKKHIPIMNLIFLLTTIIWWARGYSLESLTGYFSEGILIGYVSHLLMDMLNKTGIPLLYPFTKRKFHLADLKTGKDDYIGVLIFLIPTLIFITSKFTI